MYIRDGHVCNIQNYTLHRHPPSGTLWHTAVGIFVLWILMAPIIPGTCNYDVMMWSVCSKLQYTVYKVDNCTL